MVVIGWVDPVDADTYLRDRLGAEGWFLIGTGNPTRTTYLTTAYRYLVADPRFSYPDPPEQEMKDAQTEFALSLFQGWTQKRDDLRAQGITKFQIGNYMEMFSEVVKKDIYDISNGFGYGMLVDNLLRKYFVSAEMVGTALRDDLLQPGATIEGDS